MLAGSYLLPSEASISRSIEIAAPPAKIFPLVNGFKRQAEWPPWLEMDPQTKLSLSGPETGQGARMSWSSEKLGSGSQEIVEMVQDKLVRTKLDFGHMGQADASFQLEPAGSGTKVTWGFSSDLGGNPRMRWMGLYIGRQVGADYEKGLAKIKAVAEK
jgi:hypothetical protein